MSGQQKTKTMESIQEIKRGATDTSGNKVVNVLSSGNEFVIYEIDDLDMTNRLRVLIDGHTNESEKILQDKFTRVKQKYIKAKGLLYNSQTQHTMKARVAHALSSVLLADGSEYDNVFDELIKELQEERKSMVKGKIFYSLPILIIVLICFVVFLCSIICPDKAINISNFSINIIMLCFGSLIGCCLSILYSLQKLQFDSIDSNQYWQIGVERIIISLAAAGAIFVAIKSSLIFGFLELDNNYKITFIGILAGFSESFVPSLLGKFKISEKLE